MAKSKNHATKGVPMGDRGQFSNRDDELCKKYTVSFIAINDIETEGQLVRAEMDSDHVIELSNSIASTGLLEPIVVRRSGNKYQLIAGAHRLAACKRLNWKDIPSHVLPESNTAPVKSLALIENIIRRDLSLEEECTAIKALYDDQGLSISQICDLLGKSRTWVQKRLCALSMPEDIREVLWDGSISLQVAEILCEVQDEATRKQIANQAIFQKLGSHIVRQIVDVYKDAPSISEAVEKGIQAASEIQNAPPPSTHCAACGRLTDYRKLKAIFICIDEHDCQEYVMKKIKNAN